MLAMIRRIFLILVDSRALTPGVLPTSADTVAAAALTLTAAAAWTWGVWVEFIAAAANTVDRQITGLTLENFVGAASQGEVQIGTGAGGAEVVEGTWSVVSHYYTLPNPIRIPPATRIACRYRTSTGVADTVDAKLLTQTGF